MDIPSELSGKAISLEHIGVSEVAWLKEDAFALIEHLDNEGKFILGGDVLSLETDGYRHNGANWHYNYEDGNAHKSVEKARDYIKKYPAGNDVFVIVVG